jgi:hypothetical protein
MPVASLVLNRNPRLRLRHTAIGVETAGRQGIAITPPRTI